MYSEERVKEELEELKYYYQQKDKLDVYLTELSSSVINELVEKYSKIISCAPIKLYHVYVGLYMKGWSQIALAREMGYTRYYVQILNGRLIQYLKESLDK